MSTDHICWPPLAGHRRGSVWRCNCGQQWIKRHDGWKMCG